MVRNVIVASMAAWFSLGAATLGHHSVTVNFDNSKAMNLTGRIKELDIRNPHSRITLEVKQPDGMLKEWLIEWSDRNALIRRKVPFQLLRVGDTVTINASPSRSLDNLAYFRTAVLPDSSILRDCGFAAFREAIANGETVNCEPEQAK
jgi:Family of unknown function (DUF6152)